MRKHRRKKTRQPSEEETVRSRPARMKLPTDKDFSYAMTALRIVSRPVGTWPLQTYSFSSGLRSAIVIVLLMLTMLIVQVEIYLDYGNAEKTLNGLVILACSLLAVLKVGCFRLYPTGLIANFVSAVQDYQQLNGEEKRAIVKRHAYMGRMSSASMIFFSYFSASLFTLAPMFTGNDAAQGANSTLGKRLDYPVPSEYTLQLLRAPENLFAVIYFGEYFLLLVTAIGNLGSDSLFFGIVFHLCGQVEVLKLDFSRFLDDEENRTDRFSSLIKRHHHLLKLFQYLNDTIGSIMVIQLFTSCLLICFQFILSLNVNNLVMVMKTFIVMATLLGQLFAYSLVGEYSKNQFEGIGQLAYCSSWYNAPPNLTRDIMFLLMKTQYPVHLKAGRFFVINMETYTSILRTSMSYLSVLRVMVTA
ncbi:odorant receptor 10-like isoform X2 [Nomia melanderi]|uniref:odorant receptor 10-like isoform X2 n=1 Tax=Nomia melanderi TaxID=2448451 RepID=UPI003FCDA660